MNILTALRDPNLLGSFMGDLSTWEPWLTALKVVYGLPIRGKAERELVRTCTGRNPDALPKSGFQEALFLTGRRSGKSRIAATITAYESVLSGRESRLSKGEVGVVPVISPTKNQSRIVHDYLRGAFETPLLAQEISRERAGHDNSFELKNSVRVETMTGDWRTVRGFTLLAAVVDEACFFAYSEESKVKSDTELIRALRPALATTGGRLIAISSPYAMKGWAYQKYRKDHANDQGRTLVWKCPSRTMNPTLPQSIIDEALAEDPAAARAEYFAEFRDDIVTYIPREVVEACVVKGRTVLPPQAGTRYSAFCDISGGRGDDATLAIAHRDARGIIVIDLARRWRPPFSPDEVIGQMVEVLRLYGIDRIVGDNYSAEFTKSSFESRGIRYARATVNPWARHPALTKTPKTKSTLYLELLPRLCSGEVELPDDEVLINQLANLERRTRSGGRDTVDHGPNQHDDLANAVAGVVDSCAERRTTVGVFDDTSTAPGVAPGGSSAFARHMERVRREAELFEQEQQRWLRERADPNAEWRDFMRYLGRR